MGGKRICIPSAARAECTHKVEVIEEVDDTVDVEIGGRSSVCKGHYKIQVQKSIARSGFTDLFPEHNVDLNVFFRGGALRRRVLHGRSAR